MFNYMKAELYKILFAGKAYWIFLLLISAFLGVSSCFITVPVIAPTISACNSVIVLNSLGGLIPTSLIITVIYFCSAYKNGLFKNDVAYGFKRSNIYTSKFVIGLLLLTLMWICIACVFTLTLIFKFGFAEIQTHEFMLNLKIVSTAIIDSYVYLAIIHSIFFVIKNTITASIISFIAPSFIKLFMSYISSNLKIPPTNNMLWCLIAVIIWFLGLKLFEKTEIK